MDTIPKSRFLYLLILLIPSLLLAIVGLFRPWCVAKTQSKNVQIKYSVIFLCFISSWKAKNVLSAFHCINFPFFQDDRNKRPYFSLFPRHFNTIYRISAPESPFQPSLNLRLAFVYLFQLNLQVLYANCEGTNQYVDILEQGRHPDHRITESGRRRSSYRV